MIFKTHLFASLIAICLFASGCSNTDTPSEEKPQQAQAVTDASATPALPIGALRPSIQSYEIIATHPHDARAFTQGLFYWNGFLYESTGQFGESTIRKTNIATGDVIAFRDIPPEYFGEGITRWKDKIIALTWRAGTGFVIDLDSLTPLDVFGYPGEGWGITASDTHLIQSDGSPILRFLNPETFEIERTLSVKLNGKPLRNINELEWINGEIWSNVWQSELIARIDPETGHVRAVIDFTGLTPDAARSDPSDNVLNGIAYDDATGRIWVTGKRWPELYEIKVTDFGAPK